MRTQTTRAEWIAKLERTAETADEIGSHALAATAREMAAIHRQLQADLDAVDVRLAARLAAIEQGDLA